MIYRWKALDLAITDFEYHHDHTRLGEIIPSQTSTIDKTTQNIFYKTNFSYLCTPIDVDPRF